MALDVPEAVAQKTGMIGRVPTTATNSHAQPLARPRRSWWHEPGPAAAALPVAVGLALLPTAAAGHAPLGLGAFGDALVHPVLSLRPLAATLAFAALLSSQTRARIKTGFTIFATLGAGLAATGAHLALPGPGPLAAGLVVASLGAAAALALRLPGPGLWLASVAAALVAATGGGPAAAPSSAAAAAAGAALGLVLTAALGWRLFDRTAAHRPWLRRAAGGAALAAGAGLALGAGPAA